MLANNFPGSHLQINVSRAVPQSATPPVKTHLDTFLKDLPTNGMDSNPGRAGSTRNPLEYAEGGINLCHDLPVLPLNMHATRSRLSKAMT